MFDKLAAGFSKVSTKVKVNSPVIFLVTGTICLGGAVIAAHHAGRKVDEVLDVNKEHLDNIRSLKGQEEIINEEGEREPYSDRKWRKDMSQAYLGAAWDMTKLYGPVAILTVSSAVCYIGGHKVLARRLAGMTAAYTLVNESFEQYRQNVIDMDGEDQDKKYLFGKSIEHIKDGKLEKINPETKEIESVKVKDIDLVKDIKLNASPYAVSLEDCKGFTKDPNYNVRWLESVMNMANIKLQQMGYLFLYDVYEALGVTPWVSPEAIKASHCVGWLIGVGDGEVKFNLISVPEKCMTVDGEVVNLRESALIDFNCVGTILDRI